MQQKLNVNERKESSSFVINNNCINNKANVKGKDNEKMNNEIFELKSYAAKVEQMSKVLEESFIRERDKCLTVVEIEDRPHLTNTNFNSIQDSKRNINYAVF